ncbi:MAG TPA: lipase maturation factor family protein [Thermoanaerobaculia bacterium]|nr:lipase maturation factor family protein [Thermoanaerobaculia bacterium]
MPSVRRVASPPAQPLGVFDGDCGFCRLWVARWRAMSGGAVDYAPSQEVGERYPEIPKEAFRRAFQLILPDGRVFEGAEAALAASSRRLDRGVLVRAYRAVPGLAPLLDLAYRTIAAHRSRAMRLTRVLWGRSVERPTYAAATSLFIRLLGLCYLAAFVSFWVQADGLVGDRGILPIRELLEWVRARTGAERYWLLPTLSWIAPGNGGLHAICAAGVAASIALIAGVLPALAAAGAWLCYLSVSCSGQLFLEFQWDLLLLETGLLAVFLVSPRRVLLRSGEAPRPLARFLLVWLLFRLILSSGIVKLTSGDPTWRNLTALRYHYWTQPLPTWTAWYVHWQPWLATVSCVVMFAVELGAPLLYFAPARLRRIGAAATIALQLAIAATGNYAFFNLLTVSLAVLLLDDAAFPRRWSAAARRAPADRGWPRAILVPVAVLTLAASAVPFLASLGAVSAIPAPLVAVYRLAAPLRSTNGYGLFAVMTTSRPEIVIEASADGETWKPYAFRDKPDDPTKRPGFVAPHQPRLDWQLWFAALGSYRENEWVMALLERLLEADPDVLRLFAASPFGAAPPRAVRALLYDYRFTTPEERTRTGAWWTRELRGLYAPAVGRGDREPSPRTY